MLWVIVGVAGERLDKVDAEDGRLLASFDASDGHFCHVDVDLGMAFAITADARHDATALLVAYRLDHEGSPSAGGSLGLFRG